MIDVFNQIDQDGNGTLDRLFRYTLPVYQFTYSTLSGTLEEGEFAQAIHSMNFHVPSGHAGKLQPPTVAQVHSAFILIDKAGTGSITASNFKETLRAHADQATNQAHEVEDNDLIRTVTLPDGRVVKDCHDEYALTEAEIVECNQSWSIAQGGGSWMPPPCCIRGLERWLGNVGLYHFPNNDIRRLTIVDCKPMLVTAGSKIMSACEKKLTVVAIVVSGTASMSFPYVIYRSETLDEMEANMAAEEVKSNRKELASTRLELHHHGVKDVQLGCGDVVGHHRAFHNADRERVIADGFMQLPSDVVAKEDCLIMLLDGPDLIAELSTAYDNMQQYKMGFLRRTPHYKFCSTESLAKLAAVMW